MKSRRRKPKPRIAVKILEDYWEGSNPATDEVEVVIHYEFKDEKAKVVVEGEDETLCYKEFNKEQDAKDVYSLLKYGYHTISINMLERLGFKFE